MRAKLIAVVSRPGFVLSGGRLSDEASDELRLHLELLTVRYIGSGIAAGCGGIEAPTGQVMYTFTLNGDGS